jgi:mono/diheme cytochrome c family protein
VETRGSPERRRVIPRGSALLVFFGLLGACGGAGPEASPKPEPRPAGDPAVVTAVDSGRELFFGKAACSACHKVGEEGKMIVGPNLGIGDGMTEPVGLRATRRRPDAPPIEYVIESILDPDAVVVESYARGVMKSPDDLPQEISDEELVHLAAFIVAQGKPEELDAADLGRAAAAIPRARQAKAQR